MHTWTVMKAQENVPEMQQFYGNTQVSPGPSETDQNSVEPSHELDDFELKGKLSFRTKDVYKDLKENRIIYRGFFENKTPVAIERVQKMLWTVSTNQLREFDRHENIVRYFVTEEDDDF